MLKLIAKSNYKLFAVLIAVVFFPAQLLEAEGEFTINSELFIEQSFNGEPPITGMIWLTGDKKEIATGILGHEPDFMRLRYWGGPQRSAWIVDEIGKTEPITIGVVVNGNTIEDIKVLAFRESRGWEIKHDFFTRQFKGASIKEDRNLTQAIDGISGATLSVRAMNKVSRLVLYLSQSLSG